MWFAETTSEKADLAKVIIEALQTAIPMRENKIKLLPYKEILVWVWLLEIQIPGFGNVAKHLC